MLKKFLAPCKGKHFKRKWEDEVRVFQAISWWNMYQETPFGDWKNNLEIWLSTWTFIMKENINDIQPMLDLMLEGWWGRIQEKKAFLMLSPLFSPSTSYKILTYNSDKVCEWGLSGPLIQKLHYVKVIWSQFCNHFCTTSKYYTPETDIIKSTQIWFGKTRQGRKYLKFL